MLSHANDSTYNISSVKTVVSHNQGHQATTDKENHLGISLQSPLYASKVVRVVESTPGKVNDTSPSLSSFSSSAMHGTDAHLTKLNTQSAKSQSAAPFLNTFQSQGPRIVFPRTSNHYWDATPTRDPIPIGLPYGSPGGSVSIQVKVARNVWNAIHALPEGAVEMSAASYQWSQKNRELHIAVDRVGAPVAGEGLFLLAGGDTALPEALAAAWPSVLRQQERSSPSHSSSSSSNGAEGHLPILAGINANGAVALHGLVLTGWATPLRLPGICPTGLGILLLEKKSLVQGTSHAMGFLSVDAARRLVLLAEGDPVLESLPVIGMWLSHPGQLPAAMVTFLTNFHRVTRRTGSSGRFLCLVAGHRGERQLLEIACAPGLLEEEEAKPVTPLLASSSSSYSSKEKWLQGICLGQHRMMAGAEKSISFVVAGSAGLPEDQEVVPRPRVPPREMQPSSVGGASQHSVPAAPQPHPSPVVHASPQGNQAPSVSVSSQSWAQQLYAPLQSREEASHSSLPLPLPLPESESLNLSVQQLHPSLQYVSLLPPKVTLPDPSTITEETLDEFEEKKERKAEQPTALPQPPLQPSSHVTMDTTDHSKRSSESKTTKTLLPDVEDEEAKDKEKESLSFQSPSAGPTTIASLLAKYGQEISPALPSLVPGSDPTDEEDSLFSPDDYLFLHRYQSQQPSAL